MSTLGEPRIGSPQAFSFNAASVSGVGQVKVDKGEATKAEKRSFSIHLGSSLTDVTCVFDEPTIGLHPLDIQRMNTLLLQLREKGSTVLMVEHKPAAIEVADHIVDLGPGAGAAGGGVTFGEHLAAHVGT